MALTRIVSGASHTALAAHVLAARCCVMMVLLAHSSLEHRPSQCARDAPFLHAPWDYTAISVSGSRPAAPTSLIFAHIALAVLVQSMPWIKNGKICHL